MNSKQALVFTEVKQNPSTLKYAIATYAIIFYSNYLKGFIFNKFRIYAHGNVKLPSFTE